MIDDAQRKLLRLQGDRRGTEGLESELEWILADAVAGEPAGPALGKTLERLAREVLLRRGLGAAKVLAHMGEGGIFVRVLLPPGVARVSQIQVAVGEGGSRKRDSG